MGKLSPVFVLVLLVVKASLVEGGHGHDDDEEHDPCEEKMIIRLGHRFFKHCITHGKLENEVSIWMIWEIERCIACMVTLWFLESWVIPILSF